jgi:hypothetical protein
LKRQDGSYDHAADPVYFCLELSILSPEEEARISAKKYCLVEIGPDKIAALHDLNRRRIITHMMNFRAPSWWS